MLLNSLAERWVPTLGRACWQGALAAVAVWCACRLFPRLAPATRALLWWLVCLRMLLGLAGVEPLRVAVLPAAPTPVVTARVVASDPVVPLPTVADVAPVMRTGPSPIVPSAPAIAPHLTLFGGLLLLWLSGVAVQVALAVRERRLVLRSLDQAQRGGDWELLHDVAVAVGLAKVPPVLVSARASGSLVVGILRPTVVLSYADLVRLSPHELRALLAHELTHVRRHDLWAGTLPFLTRVLFFFHPLVWLACREYDLAREAACDAEALRVSGLPPAEYGRLLLKLGIPSPPAALAALGASPHGQQLRRRLLGLAPARTLPRWCSAAVVLVVAATLSLQPIRAAVLPTALTPVSLPRAAARPTPHVPRLSPKGNQPMSQPKLTNTVATLSLAGASLALAPTPALPQAAPKAPLAPVPPVAHVALAPSPVAPVAPFTFDRIQKQAGRYQWTIRRGESVWGHTSERTVAEAQRTLAKAQPGDCMVVDREGKRYIITDPATLQKVQDNYAALEAQGKLMEAKGAEMEASAKPMEELGKQMEALGKQMEAKGKELEVLGQKLANANDSERQAIQEQMRAVQAQMKVPADEMRTLAQKMREVHGGKMRELGNQMRELGNQMRVLAKEADSKMNGILDDAFKNNLAVEQKG